MISEVEVTALACECDLCHYKWLSLALDAPEQCRNRACRSREWNGKKMVSHVNEIKFPAPRRPGRRRSIAVIDFREEQ